MAGVTRSGASVPVSGSRLAPRTSGISGTFTDSGKMSPYDLQVIKKFFEGALDESLHPLISILSWEFQLPFVLQRMYKEYNIPNLEMLLDEMINDLEEDHYAEGCI